MPIPHPPAAPNTHTPAPVPTCRARLGAEAVAKGGHADGQLRLAENLIHVHAAQGNLSGAGQAGGGVGQGVNLRGVGIKAAQVGEGWMVLVPASRSAQLASKQHSCGAVSCKACRIELQGPGQAFLGVCQH